MCNLFRTLGHDCSYQRAGIEHSASDERMGRCGGEMSRPSAGWRSVRSCYPSPRRSHGVLAEAEHFHDSLWPENQGIEVGGKRSHEPTFVA